MQSLKLGTPESQRALKITRLVRAMPIVGWTSIRAAYKVGDELR
eukprot:CAMPEP_0171100950 /NCGR_PEP_ID=MMETSP0766_2-20121228/53573_1 /TAXON_ID=439317 /ORGANISM="Gambierdiscus australes, Strain CAWD 149" /LENGTH=43 /DNA_ID= /DNA_START= /DNA_END= /DNA_ORIENTATION=